VTYTEEEAKKNWCPFARVREANNGAAAAVNIRSFHSNPHVRCIASACMAWRWKSRFGTDPDNPENCAVLPPTHGYCGLAGRPE
jgi:hypothetical protein